MTLNPRLFNVVDEIAETTLRQRVMGAENISEMLADMCINYGKVRVDGDTVFDPAHVVARDSVVRVT